ncbi:MAG: VCBS repeat-containing protein [Thermoplasmata archaeon]|nr:VCBS repeat-containing protein [Thermoplasmata archaeon]
MKSLPVIVCLLLLVGSTSFLLSGEDGSISRIIVPRLLSEDIAPYCWGLAVGDIFGNGSFAVLAGSNNRVVGLSHENGTRIWESQELSGNVRKIAVGNVTGDARCEVLVATHDGHLYIIDALENQILLDWDKSHFTNGAIFGLCVCDLDGDNVNEIVVGTGTASISVYNYNAGLLFMKGMTMTQDAVFEVKIGDVDGDGRKDIVFVDWRGNTESTVRVLDYYFGQFTQKFASPYIPGILSALTVDDLNGDGVDEIVAGSGDGFIWIISIGNVSGGSTRTDTVFVSHAQIFGVAVGDFEGDGIKDIACTTWDGYIYITDTQTKTVKYLSEKRPTDIGNSNSVLFFGQLNSSKEVLVATESGIPDISPGRVLFYATKNIEILNIEYSPRFPEINQNVTFSVEILSVSANIQIELKLSEILQGDDTLIGTAMLKNTRPNTKYYLNFTWIPVSAGYKSVKLECNADGEVLNKTSAVCVAVKMELSITVGKYLRNKTLVHGEKIELELTRGEVVEVSIRIVNNAPYTLFNLALEIFLDDSLFMTKRFDISGAEEFSFKLDTFIMNNGTFELTIKSKLINPMDNTESIYSTYVIDITLRTQVEYLPYILSLLPAGIILVLVIGILLLVQRQAKKYKKLWQIPENFLRKE